MAEKDLDFDMIKNVYVYEREELETVELNNDYVLPDYIADITKFVRCEARAVLHNCFDNGTSIQCEGEVVYNILVVCEDGEIKSIAYSEDFNVSCSNEGIPSDPYIYCRLNSRQVRLTGPRKLNCRCRIDIIADFNKENDIIPNCDEIIKESSGMQIKKKPVELLKTAGYTESNLHASHDIELPSGLPEVESIVYCRVNTNISEIKYIDEKLALRGETVADILYRCAEGKYHKVNKCFGYSEFLSQRFAEGSCCMAGIITKDIKLTVQNNSFGEMRILELDYSYDIEHRYYKNTIADMIEDAYSVSFGTELSCDKLKYKRLADSFGTSLSINELYDCEENITSVTDSYCEVLSSELKYDSDLKKYTVSGELQWSIICTVCDDDNNESYNCLSYILPYKYERDACGFDNEILSELYVNILREESDLDKGKLQINCELYINAAVMSVESAEYVDKIKYKDTDNIKDYPLVVYYPKTNDSLWSIAKKYRTTIQEIASANGIEDISVLNTKVLIIPKKAASAAPNFAPFRSTNKSHEIE